jgi:hypothetical protein
MKPRPRVNGLSALKRLVGSIVRYLENNSAGRAKAGFVTSVATFMALQLRLSVQQIVADLNCNAYTTEFPTSWLNEGFLFALRVLDDKSFAVQTEVLHE